MRVEECSKLSRYLQKLSAQGKRLADEYRIKTLDELIIFLISQLNRTKNLKEDDSFHALYLLIGKILIFLEKYPDPEIHKLVEQTKKCDFKNADAVMKMRSQWTDAISSNTFAYLGKLDKFGYFNKNNLKELIDEVAIYLDKESEVGAVAKMFTEILGKYGHSEKSVRLKSELIKNPEIVASATVIEDIKEQIDTMFQNRVESVQTISNDFKSVMESFSHQSQQFKDKLESFKDDIRKDNSSLQSITAEIQESVDDFHGDIKQGANEAELLKKKIERIQEQLQEEQRKSQTDSLTNLYNRRAILEIMNNYEKRYAKFNKSYSFAFFKLENEERIGKEFGRFASDAILSNVGKIVNNRLNSISKIGRYSGSVFAVVSYETQEKLEMALFELKTKLGKSKFMYEKKRIGVNIEYATAIRKDFSKQTQMLNTTYEKMGK